MSTLDGECPWEFEDRPCTGGHPNVRETPRRLSLVGQTVRLGADEAEGFEEELVSVEADYEYKKADGFERFIQGRCLITGDYVEAPYSQVIE